MDNVIPNIERAIINPRKLYEYALNPNHPIGRNKAKVFENALGYNQSNTDDLIRQIYEKLPNSKVLLGKVDEYGQRYTIDINISRKCRPHVHTAKRKSCTLGDVKGATASGL